MANEIVPVNEMQGEVIFYQPDSTMRLEVRLEDETVWLTQQQMVDLFQSSKANVSEHIRNIYDQGELEQKATVRNFRTVRKEGNRMVNRTLTYYNLDAIISVGFRVNTKRGIMFRQEGDIKRYMNSQPDKEEAAGTVLKASLPFLKSDECERVKGQLSYIVQNMKEEHQKSQNRGYHM